MRVVLAGEPFWVPLSALLHCGRRGLSMEAQGSLFLPGLKPWKYWFGLDLGSESAVRKQSCQTGAEAEISQQAESQI